MRTFLLGLAVAALASAGPAFAGDKKQSTMKDEKPGSASMQKSANEGRGGLEEWPVSKEPADWSHMAPGSASAGEGAGDSGARDRESSER